MDGYYSSRKGGFIVFVIVPLLLLILLVLHYILDYKITIKDVYEAKISETAGFFPYLWTGAATFIVLIIAIFSLSSDFPPIIVAATAVALAVRLFFEKRYIPHTKRYIVTGILLGAMLVLFIAATLLFYYGFI